MNFSEILETIYNYYPPDPQLYEGDNFYKSPAGERLYTTWKNQDEEAVWIPFLNSVNNATGLDFTSIYRGTEFCFKAWTDF